MPCFTTYRVLLTMFAATCALTAVIPRVSTSSRGCEQAPSSAASSAAVRVSSAEPACEYGIQPYYFMPTHPAVPWNVTPRTWDLRAFDARCQPRQLVDRLLEGSYSASNDSQLSIILYGDR